MLLIRDPGFYRRLAALAIPVALQNLISFAVGFADSLMVQGLGDAAISGVYMGGQLQTFLQMFSGGIEGTILILGAQYWGKRDRDSVTRIVSIGARISISIAVLLAAACFFLPGQILSLFTSEASVIREGGSYLHILSLSFPLFCTTQALTAALRCVGKPRAGMYASAVALAANVLLNFLLIRGLPGLPAMGVSGAALATLIARISETGVMLFFALHTDRELQLRPRDFASFDRRLSAAFLRCGLPIMSGQIVWSINNMAGSSILGRMGESVTTAAGIANSMSTLAYVFMNGLAAAVGITTSRIVGSGQLGKLRSYVRTVQCIFIGMGALSFAFIQLLRKPFIGLYAGASPAAAALAMQFTGLLSIAMAGTCYQQAGLYGLVKAGGDTGFVFRMDAIFVLCVVLPAALVALRLGAAPWTVYACLKADQLLKCPVAAVKINRLNWVKNLTSTEKRA